MKYNYKRHLIESNSPIKESLSRLEELGADAIVFIINEDGKLLGALTDGDIRRGLIKGTSLDSNVNSFIQPNPKYICRGKYTINEIIEYREKGLKVLPVIDSEGIIVNVINFRFLRSYLPVDAVIMAGGRGERLKPLTDVLPKPLLEVGGKAIIQHNIDRLINFGIDDYWISIRYLGDKIKDFLGDGLERGVSIKYIQEDDPLGTVGAISLIEKFENDYVLITNSDLLTNLDYENFFLDFINSDSDFSVATIPYNVNIPYAILETADGVIKSFKEKPTYTYYANAGIYLMKKHLCENIPKNQKYDTTDLLDYLITNNYKVTSYPLRGYWLDIGKHDDYKKAQDDINYIKF